MGNTCARPVNPRTISFEDIANFPRRAEIGRQNVPTCLRFSPDDSHVTYLQAEKGGLRQTLFSIDLKTGERTKVINLDEEKDQEFSEEEKLRRERLRQLHTGITSYTWAEEGNLILVPMNGDLYVKEGLKGPFRRIVDSSKLPGAVMDARLTSDGNSVAFVCKGEVYMVSTAKDGKPPQQVTFGARENGLTNGIADYVAQEEMSRYEGFWVSPDAKHVAFEQVDESHIPEYHIMHQGSDKVPPLAQETHRYPFAGAANPKVKLGITTASGDDQKVRWLDLEQCFGEDLYLARVGWVSSTILMFAVQNRDQSKLDIMLYDLDKNSYDTLLKEREPKYWLNLTDIFIPYSKGFIVASEKSGFRHLYTLSGPGGSLKALTEGKWLVDNCTGQFVDEKKGVVYFMGTREGCKTSHLYSVKLENSGTPPITQVTAGKRGMHSVIISNNKKMYIDVYSSCTEPFRVAVMDFDDGSCVQEIHECKDKGLIKAKKLVTPRFVQIPSADPKFTMECALYIPPEDVFGKGPFPTIVSVYGGPHFQAVQDAWPLTADLRAQHFAQNGYLVAKIDNRGSARRGLEFEGALKFNMGSPEVEDQAAAVQWLISNQLTIQGKVGMYGWSYGGYMSLMCLAKKPDLFQAAVSGAPVTHWDGYDTHYTERYMGTPTTNEKGYEESSVMYHAKNFKGKLMLVHGLIDENVHFRHTARLINALIHHRFDYKLMIFPDERHQPRKIEDRVYMEEMIFQYLTTSLQ